MKTNVIIFEGIDHTGKSTRAKETIKQLIAKGHNPKLLHIDGDHPNTFEAFDRDVITAITEGHDVIVFDRWAIGELVYGNSYREKSRITLDEIKEFIELYEPSIYVRYVKNKDFIEYAKMLELRDNEVYVDDEYFLKSVYEIKKAEQGHFKTIMDMLKYNKLNTSYFEISDLYE